MTHYYYTDRAIAQKLAVHRCTIWRWVKEGKFPRPIKLNGSTRFRAEDVEHFLSNLPQ